MFQSFNALTDSALEQSLTWSTCTMQLTYRSIPYSLTNNTLSVQQSQVLGTYRGQHYPIHHSTHSSIGHEEVLKFRGVEYQANAA